VSFSHRAAACFLLIASAGIAPGQTTPPMPRSEDPKLLAERNALLAEIERLNKLLEARQPTPVSSWRVSGKVRANLVELKISFTFVTTRDRAVVSLGCTRSQNLTVSLDGKPAPLLNLDGLVLEVETAGKHEAVVEALMALREIAPSGPAPRPPLAVEPLQGSHKGFLCQLFGQFAIADQIVDETDHWPRVPFKDQTKRFLVAATRTRH
jgi:hypothetical protein